MTPTPPTSLFSHLSVIPDPRREASVDHPLPTILFIAVCAVICGAETVMDIERWSKAKAAWLETLIPLPYGIPSHDTFRRVLMILSPLAFREAFVDWVKEAVRLHDGEVVAVDGKTVRRSRSARHGLAAIQIVSAFATRNGLVLGQVKTDSKSNEITAIPELLRVLELSGCLVSIDAMGCQKAIAEQIVEQGADYLLAVKTNQPTLHEICEETVQWAIEEEVTTLGGDYAHSSEVSGGIEVIREVWSVPAPVDLEDLTVWKGLRSIVFAKREVIDGAERTVGQRLFISSRAADNAPSFLHAVRQHWAIENTVHWSLDVTFDEDRHRFRSEHGAENMSRLRHIALNLLKQETSRKDSIRGKRKIAGWDNDYLLKILGL